MSFLQAIFGPAPHTDAPQPGAPEVSPADVVDDDDAGLLPVGFATRPDAGAQPTQLGGPPPDRWDPADTLDHGTPQLRPMEGYAPQADVDELDADFGRTLLPDDWFGDTIALKAGDSKELLPRDPQRQSAKVTVLGTGAVLISRRPATSTDNRATYPLAASAGGATGVKGGEIDLTHTAPVWVTALADTSVGLVATFDRRI